MNSHSCSCFNGYNGTNCEIGQCTQQSNCGASYISYMVIAFFLFQSRFLSSSLLTIPIKFQLFVEMKFIFLSLSLFLSLFLAVLKFLFQSLFLFLFMSLLLQLLFSLFLFLTKRLWSCLFLLLSQLDKAVNALCIPPEGSEKSFRSFMNFRV